MRHHHPRAALLHATVIAVGISLGAVATAAADGVDVFVDAANEFTFYVNTDGTHYTELATDQPGAIPIHFDADLRIEGGRDRIFNWTVAPHLHINGKTWGWIIDSTSRPPEDAWGVASKSYDCCDRPSVVHRFLVMKVDPSYIDDFVVQACNDKADQLRTQGGSNTAIFSSAHVLQPTLTFQHKVTYRNMADLHNDPVESTGLPPLQPKIVCMKYEGAHRNVSDNLQASVAVTQATVTTIEKYGAGGMCKIILSGVIETNVANAEVKFRYEHNNGKKSDVKTVKTDFTKTVMFSDAYDVPNNPDGDEIGMVRMVGKNIAFESGWSVYQMHCTKPGPQDLQAKTLPKLDLTVAAGKTEMVNGQICPATLLIQGLVKAGSAFDGKALFLGDAFLTAPQPVSVGANKVQHLFANRDLDWSLGDNFAGTLSSGNAPAALKSQKVRIGFNLADATGKLVGQVPQKWYTVTCKKPEVNPGVSPNNGGMVSAPSN